MFRNKLLSSLNTIRGRLFLLLATVLLPILLVQALIYKDRFELRREDELRANMDVARGVCMAFGQFVDDVLHQEQVIGMSIASNQLSRENIQRILEQSADEHTSVVSFAWVDPEGKVLYSTFTEDEGIALETKTFFIEMRSGSPTHVSDLFLLQNADKPVFTISRAFRDEQENLLGVVVAVVDPDFLHHSIGFEREGRGAFAVIDRNGRLVFRNPKLDLSWEERYLGDRPFIQDALAGREYYVEEGVGAEGIPRVYAFTPIDSIGWISGASKPTSEIISAVRSRLIRHSLMFVGVVLLAIPFAAWMANTISAPVRLLRKKAVENDAGDFADEIIGPSEVQDLASTFQDRARRLKDLTNELEARVLERTRELTRMKGLYDEGERIAGRFSWEWNLTDNVFTFTKNFWLLVHGLEQSYPAKLPREEVLGFIHPDDLQAFDSALNHTMSDRTEFTIIFRMGRQDNASMRVFDAHGEFFEGDDGKFVRGWAQDITELTSLENALKKTNQELEAANRAKNEFLANMSHEMRTPLSGILGLTEITLDNELPEETRRNLELIRSSSLALHEIINDLLDFSTIEAGRFTIRPLEFSLRDEIANLTAAFEDQARLKGILFEVSIDDEVPSRIVADPSRVKQILINLLNNAFKFTLEERVELSVRRADPAHLVFSILDTGIGIPGEKIGDIFQSFTQVDASVKKRFGGTGLGLSISRKLAELMGGSIGVESTEGVGSRFTLTLPFELPETPTQDLETKTASDMQPLRILLAEDNPVNQLVIERFLTRQGHSVVSVSDGRQALLELAKSGFDLVLMDIQMPVMDGIETTKAIRQGPSGTNRTTIPIIALTAYAMKGDREKFLAEGMNGYVTKPVDFGELAKVIADVCEGAGRSKG
jgi:signal transduction histidine kinase/ActR/RegA family two-component response regulator